MLSETTVNTLFEKPLSKLTLAISACLLLACSDKSAEPQPNLKITFGAKHGELRRLATLPMGAEVAGFVETQQGDIFFNVQHPYEHHSDNPDNNSLPDGIGLARIGVIEGVTANQIPFDFTSLSVPVDDLDKSRVRLALGQYNTLAKERDTFSGKIPFGLGVIPSFDQQQGLDEKSIAKSLIDNPRSNISQYFGEALSTDMPDLNVFVPSNEEGSRGYLYTAWESRPSTMSRMALHKKEGHWQVHNNDVSLVDFNTRSLMGAWHLCSGSLSPWGTPLANEEFFNDDDVVNWNNPDPRSKTFARAYGGVAFLNPQLNKVELTGSGEEAIADYAERLAEAVDIWPNPYRYGYAIEIEQPLADKPKPVKRYAMGRYTHEVALVMPDLKTVYLTSDDRPSGFFKFVADEAEDLSSGTLYAIKLKQDHSRDKAHTSYTGFDVSWVELGNANDQQIEALIEQYDNVGLKAYGDDSNSYIRQTEIDAYADQYRREGKADNPALAFIETRAVAIALGATVELDGVEGLTANYERLVQAHEKGQPSSMYLAASYMRDTVADEEGDMQLTENVCGVVYRMDMDLQFNVNRMEPEIIGGPYDSKSMNRCSLDSVAQPDNILELRDGRLLVGEDTRSHINNMIWVYTPNKLAGNQ